MTESVTHPRDLAGKIAVVTGAAQGLGLGMAEVLARRGVHVVLADLKKDLAEQSAVGLRDQGLSAEAVAIDIGSSGSVNDCFEQIVRKNSRLDIVVNNAGVGQNVAAVVSLSDEEWQRVINITLTGAFYCCRAAGRIMQSQESGTIVNISSINGQNPAALVAAYNVAKAGVISLTRCLALEMAAYGVRVNAVCPGPVYTEFNRTVMAQRCQSLNLEEEQMIERIRGAIPLGRWGQAQDIGEAVAFLCSPQASWITGEVMRVSGGLEGVSAAPPKAPKP
jgi:3-oxoacyl-[acyl-carrier protein] reductase